MHNLVTKENKQKKNRLEILFFWVIPVYSNVGTEKKEYSAVSNIDTSVFL